MNKLSIVVVEGKDDRVFISNLLEKKFGFEAYTGKSPCLFKRSDLSPQLYWLFAAPSLSSDHDGGKQIIPRKETYTECKTIMYSHCHVYGNPVEIHVTALTDNDGKDEASAQAFRERAQAAASEVALGENTYEVHYPIQEIEAWYLAGLTNTFPFFEPRKAEDVERILRKNPDSFQDPKEALYSILQADISGNPIQIAAIVAEYFDVEQAIQKSASFQEFHTSIVERGLIP